MLTFVTRLHLDEELESAVVIINGTAKYNGTAYDYRIIDGFDNVLLYPHGFPLPADRETVMGAQQLIGHFPPVAAVFHNSIEWQFLDAYLNTVGCIHNEYDIIHEDAPEYYTAVSAQ